MRRLLNPLSSTRGFTTMELIIAVAILSILLAIATSSVDTLKARTRSAEARANMDAIAQAGYSDFTTHNDWAPMPAAVGTMPARFASQGLLAEWPRPPCVGWFYSWESLIGTDDYVRVALRRADGAPIWSYCVSVSKGADCNAVDPITGVTPVEISLVHQRHLYCDGTAE